MEPGVLDDKVMTGYLLGLIPEPERVKVEEAFFQSDSCFEQLTAFENDLIDEYVRGGLSTELRRAFQKKLNSDAAWKQRVVFAEALARRVADSASRAPAAARAQSFFELLVSAFRSRGPVFQFAMASGSLLVLLGAFWLSRQFVQQRENDQALRSERQNLQRAVDELKGQVAGLQQQGQDLTKQLEQERSQRQALENTRPNDGGALGLMASFVLRAGLVRGGGDPARLAVPPETRTIRLQLELDPAEDYPAYRAELRTAAGAMVWSGDRLTARTSNARKAVSIDVPAPRLPAGKYELGLQGRPPQGNPEDVGFYYFDVE